MKGYTVKLFGAVAAGMLLTALAPMLAFAGWNSGSGYWYMYEPGKVYCDQVATIDTYLYSFDENAYMETGWIKLDTGEWVYADSSGALVDNQWIGDSLIVDGSALTDAWWYGVNDEYYFDENGHWVPNEWYHYADGWCLWLGSQLWATDGYYRVNGEWYCFDDDGYMVTGLRDNYGVKTYFDASGKKLSNQWVDGKYYVGQDGCVVEDDITLDGYQIVDGQWDGKGKVFTWKQSSNGKWWLEYNDGTYAKGFLSLSGNTYFFDENGYMQTGWVQDDAENYYYFHSDGLMALDEWIGEYYVSYHGDMLKDAMVYAEDGMYVVGPDGAYDKYATKWIRDFGMAS